MQLREQIRALQRRLAITTVFVTHDQDEALSMADRVAVMRQGRLEQVAPPAELYSDPQTAFVAEFVGTMNRLPAKIVSPGRVAVLGQEVAARGPARQRRREATSMCWCGPKAWPFLPSRVPTGSLRRSLSGAPSPASTSCCGRTSRSKVDMPSTEAVRMAVGSSVDVSLLTDEVLVDASSRGSPVPEEV